jgi:hypothetical protein
LQAEVTMSGAKIISTSKSEGGGSFTIRASRLGRETSMQELPVVADWITMKDKVVKTGREDIVEEYTTSGDGIRQDFVINNKPEGQGKLLLDIAIEGTGVTTKSHKDGIEVRLSSGRKLLYHALKVTDATDKELESSFVKTDNNRIIIAVEDKNALYPVRIDPTITDADWSALGSGTNGIVVFALAFDDSGNLYAGGEFDTAGGIAANNIAKWNGSSWGSLGSGMNNTVRALGVDKSGNIYAGGEFDTAGGVAANRIAKWDGNAWSALGSGINYNVYCLVIDQFGNLYVGGPFTIAGSVTANCIAKWDGNAWSSLGSGMSGGYVESFVSALAVDSSMSLYAGGWFLTAGGVDANCIAKWNGSSWSALGSVTNSWECVGAIVFDGSGNLYAGGTFDTEGGVAANRIAKWDGNAWSALGSGTNSGVWALAIDSSGSLYAGGDFTSAGGVAANCIAKWDGNVWDSLGSGTNKTIFALAIDSSGNLYAGGQFTTAGGKASAYVAMCRLPGTAVIPRRGDNVSRPFLTYDAHAGLMRFQLKAQTQITYRIYSLLGRQVFQASETIGAGEHSMRINTLLNTRPAARGTYIVNFKAGDESIRFRLVVDK